MRVSFSKVKSKLRSGKVYFTPSGVDRFKDEDLISFPDDCEVEPYTGFLSGNSFCSMGAFSYSWSPLPFGVTVGRYCSIARGLKILGVRHPMERISTSSFTYDSSFVIFKSLVNSESSNFKVRPKPAAVQSDMIVIGHDVWIGADVTLKPGITIGIGSVIAASSMVVKDVPPYSVVGGNPAKIIKDRFDSATVNLLFSSEWWNYKFTDFAGMNMEKPKEFATSLKSAVRENKIDRYLPGSISLKDCL